MVQFQGDRDLRGPADFSGAAGDRYEDDGDDNDDDDDDDPKRRSSKRKASKLGMQSDPGSNTVNIFLFFFFSSLSKCICPKGLSSPRSS